MDRPTRPFDRSITPAFPDSPHWMRTFGTDLTEQPGRAPQLHVNPDQGETARLLAVATFPSLTVRDRRAARAFAGRFTQGSRPAPPTHILTTTDERCGAVTHLTIAVWKHHFDQLPGDPMRRELEHHLNATLSFRRFGYAFAPRVTVAPRTALPVPGRWANAHRTRWFELALPIYHESEAVAV